MFKTSRTLPMSLFLLFALLGVKAGAETMAPGDCTGLGHLTIPHVVVTAAESVPAGDYDAANGQTYSVPAFCRVHAVAVPTADSHINIEVWLPAKDWNGRYYQIGNGGFAGSIVYGGLADQLQAGHAVAATDTGHKAPSILGRWALGNTEAVIDFAHRAHKETHDFATAMIPLFYGQKADYTYFAGCSTGGRQALLSAKRYYADWDGIIVGAPVSHLTRQWLGTSAFHGKLWTDVAGRIPREKLPAIQRAALASCKPEAHVIQSIAADPRFCAFDPAVLACKAEDTAACLTAAQIHTLRMIYKGPHDPKTGKSLYPGLPPTMEAVTNTNGLGGWSGVVTGDNHHLESLKRPMEPEFGIGFYRYIVFEDPAWAIENFDPGRDPFLADQKRIKGETINDLFNATGTDFRHFADSGSKMLMYFGWGDQHLSPEGGIDYYRSIVEQNGGIKKTQNFFRLFMVPGMLHCLGGPGANAFGQYYGPDGVKNDADHNIYRALEAWVEKGRAPEKIIATKYVDNKPESGVAFTRPICPYPQIPVYKGQGDVKAAQNFICKEGAAAIP